MTVLIIALILFIGLILWLRQPQYAAPQVDVSANTANYRGGEFYNPAVDTQESNDPVTPTSNKFMLWYQFLFGKDPGSIPQHALPTEKVDLHQLPRQQNAIIWMGHSSYFIQADGLRFLVDPVFSASASPVPGTNKAFSGSNVYQAADIPDIDYLLISHDHWDHLDYPSIDALRSKIGHIITPTGVGSYFKQWGFPASKISEGGWFSEIKRPGVNIHILPTRHFSGRMLKRNQTLWGSFAIITASQRMYFGGDSGYGPHFKAIYDYLGPVDIAVLECGQYDANWANIHMTPEQTALAADDLHASRVLPAHNSKFKLAHHRWQDPLERVSAASTGKHWRLMTPRIGELVALDDPHQQFDSWWRNQN